MFIELVKKQILAIKNLQLVEGIKYEKLDSEDCYSLNLFTDQKKSAPLYDGTSSRHVLVEANKKRAKCPFDYVYIESEIERKFMEDCEKNDNVIFYTKLPKNFQIPTPLGPYNPDWGLVIQDTSGAGEYRYFIAETKSTWIQEERRLAENGKIACARQHFIAISSDVSEIDFRDVVKLDDIFD